MSEITGVPTATERLGRWRYTGPDCEPPFPGCITDTDHSALFLQPEGHHPLDPLLPPSLVLYCGPQGLEIFYDAGLDVGNLAMGDLLLDLGDGETLIFPSVDGEIGYSLPEPHASEIVELFSEAQRVPLSIQELDSSTNLFDLRGFDVARDLLPCAK